MKKNNIQETSRIYGVFRNNTNDGPKLLVLEDTKGTRILYGIPLKRGSYTACIDFIEN